VLHYPLEITKIETQQVRVRLVPSISFDYAWAEMSRTELDIPSLVPLRSRQVVPSLAPFDDPTESRLLDPVHDGQIILFRGDFPTLLCPRLQ
jgi:hypothetical protein